MYSVVLHQGVISSPFCESGALWLMLESHMAINAALVRLPRGPECFSTLLSITNIWKQAF